MNARIKRTLLIIVATLAIVAVSCTLSFLKPAIITDVPTIAVATTETPEPFVTPEPAATEGGAIVPVTGSILRWVDFSDFVFVPGGEFTMGEDSTTPTDNSPAHMVNLTGFWIHQAEVTNQQYALCVAAGKCSVPSHEDEKPYWYGNSYYGSYPVVGVNWYQAQEYCDFIHARLPSEAEWEKTARGTEAKIWPWGEGDPNCDLLNYNDCLDPSEPDFVRTYNNGTSPFEAMDMSGNVFEWVADWYEATYYQTSPVDNPQGPETGIKKVYRGGAYDTLAELISPLLRFNQEPEKHAANLGFRCVLVGDPESIIPPPPPCQVVGYNQPVNDPTFPTFTPMAPCPDPSVGAYCVLKAGKPVVGIVIKQSDCYSNMLFNLMGNDSPLICDETTSGDSYKYNCTGSGLAQGASITIGFCHGGIMIAVPLSCPAGYKFNPDTKYCEPEGWLPEPPCPGGYVEIDGNCYPEGTSCPEGFYTIYFGKTNICVPLDPCLLPDPPESCNPTCPVGSYDPETQCCRSDSGTPQPICPIGWSYDKMGNYCYPNIQKPEPCGTTVVNIPYCPTPTTTPTLPPPPDPCSIYTNALDCRNAKCKPIFNQQGLFTRCVSY